MTSLAVGVLSNYTVIFEKITKTNKKLSELFDVLIANSKQGQSIQVTSSFRNGYEALSEKLLSIISQLERMESIAKERQELLSKNSLHVVIKSAVRSYESTLAVIDYVDAFNAFSEPGFDKNESTGVDWLDKLR